MRQHGGWLGRHTSRCQEVGQEEGEELGRKGRCEEE